MDNNPEATEDLRWAEDQFIQPDDTIQISELEVTDKPTNTPLQEAVGRIAVNDELLDLQSATADLHSQTRPLKSTKISRTKVAVAAENSSDTRTAIGLYLDNIGKVPLLGAEQERDLARDIEQGVAARKALECPDLTDTQLQKYQRDVQKGAKAKDKFIRSNLRLVVSIAKRFPVPHGMELLDIIQEGNLGLEHAVDKFDWRLGFKFSTYATFWIRQSIGRGIDTKAYLIDLPSAKAAKFKTAMALTNGNYHDLDEENARLHLITTPTSLNKKVSDENSAEIGDLVASNDEDSPENSLLKSLDTELLQDLLKILDTRTRYAIEEHYGIEGGQGRSLRSIGIDLDLSHEAARRLVSRGIAEMKKSFIAERALDNGDDL